MSREQSAVIGGRRARWASVLLGAATVVWTAGCSEPVPQDPNVITVAVVNSPNNLDPRIGTDEISQRASQLIFDTLLALDDKLRIGPGTRLR